MFSPILVGKMWVAPSDCRRMVQLFLTAIFNIELNLVDDTS